MMSATILQKTLRDHGMKATPQRLAIAELLLTRHVHVTAQQVHDALQERFPSLSVNTVYQTLASFESADLLRRFYASGAMVFDSNTSPHDHACCQVCGAITDIPQAGACPLPEELGGWQVHSESRTFQGRCPNCKG